MAIDDIKKEILNDAKRRMAEIDKETAEEIKKIEAELKKQTDEYTLSKERDFQHDKELLETKDMSGVTLEGQRIVQEKKKAMMEKAVALTKEKLKKLSEGEREKIIKSLLTKVQKEIEIGVVYANEKDLKYLKGVKVEAADISGGLICENATKTISIDYSFETLLQQVSQEKLTEMSQILFGYKLEDTKKKK